MRAKEVAGAFSEVKWSLFLVPILAMVISAVVSMYVIQPVYRAATTLMVFKQPEYAVSYEVRMGTITLNQRLVKTYRELAQSNLIYEEVIKQNHLKMNVDELRGIISVDSLGDTEFLRITAECPNPTLAAMLANETARVLLEKVAEIMVLDNIQVIDAASPPQNPVRPNHMINILMAGVSGLLLVMGVALLRASVRSGDEEFHHPANISPRNAGARNMTSQLEAEQRAGGQDAPGGEQKEHQ